MFRVIRWTVKVSVFSILCLAYPLFFIVGLTDKDNDSFAKTFYTINEMYKYFWTGELE